MPRVFIPRESAGGETRVAATPETVGRLRKAGLTVTIQADAGAGAHFADGAYREAGAEIISEPAAEVAKADAILRVREPSPDEVDACREGAMMVSFLAPQAELNLVHRFVERKISFFSMNLIPRISRAQVMDALSSQANIAGYKAVLLAASALPKYFPLLMTAAGTIKPARVVVLGAGVAGLQAIATARRLGAQVWATDVRLAAKEQVESLGARFIDVPGMEDLEDERGYARQATPEFLERQRQVVGDQVAESDVVITTAQVPGRKAPTLVPRELVGRMRTGSVIVDLAAEQGGNCTETRVGETVVVDGVTIIGPRNVPATMPINASELYARNITAFFLSFVKDGELVLDFDDEVIRDSCVCHEGRIMHEPTKSALEGDQGS